jgi:endonuclease YncB( thermonuclease family)
MNVLVLARAGARQARFRICGIGLTALAAATISSAQIPTRNAAPLTVSGPVRVIEGDTLEVSVRGVRVGVRIAGIRVPPGNTECGRQASAAVRQLLSSGARLDEEHRLPLVSNRLLRVFRVTTADGRPVAAELTLAGLAVAEPADGEASDYPAILAGQADAQNAARGCAAAAF